MVQKYKKSTQVIVNGISILTGVSSTSAGVTYESMILNLAICIQPYRSDGVLWKNTFSVKKVWPSKVQSYLEVNA